MNEKLKLDGNKLLSHLDLVEDWMEDQWKINPIYIAFSPSSMCNHKCTFCVYHYKEFKPIYFPKPRYLSLVDEWKKMRIKSVFFAGDGDPLLNKDCVEMVEYTSKAGIDIAMNTNGRLLNDAKAKVLAENLSWIRVSLNAGTKENYGKIHGTSEKDFEIVLNNLKSLVKYKKKNSEFVIGVQCLLLQENFYEIRGLAKLLKEIGVDYLAIKPFLKHPLVDYSTEVENKDEVLKELLKAESLNDENFKFVLRENNFKPARKRNYEKCLSGPFMVEVDAKGDVYTCGPYINDKNHMYGNILDQSFEQMWKSEERKKITKEIQSKLDVSNCMPFCRPDSVNQLLWNLKNPPLHINYI
jgi:radical SAM protein with 4Fe4S-binding SPASM domain